MKYLNRLRRGSPGFWVLGFLSIAVGWPAFLATASNGSMRMEVDASLDALAEASRAPIAVTRSQRTGFASFVSTRPGHGIPVEGAQTTAKERALAFLHTYGAAFGLLDGSELVLKSERTKDRIGMDHVRFQQTYRGIPVTAGEIVVHLRGATVVAVSSKLQNLGDVDAVPMVSAAHVEDAARSFLGEQFAVDDAVFAEPQLERLNLGVFGARSSSTLLTWFVEALTADRREFMWFDALSGDVVLYFDQMPGTAEKAASLFHFMQPGALSEFFGAVLGDTADTASWGGTTTATVRLPRMGDRPHVAAIQAMLNPMAQGRPGKTSDSTYQACNAVDLGGVRAIGSVPKHAYALMVGGGTYNGRTVAGIGSVKASELAHRALSQYLAPGSDFVDAYNAFNQSCADLVGAAGITANDCTQVRTAMLAVELNVAYSCPSAQAAAPDQCSMPGEACPGRHWDQGFVYINGVATNGIPVKTHDLLCHDSNGPEPMPCASITPYWVNQWDTDTTHNHPTTGTPGYYRTCNHTNNGCHEIQSTRMIKVNGEWKSYSFDGPPWKPGGCELPVTHDIRWPKPTPTPTPTPAPTPTPRPCPPGTKQCEPHVCVPIDHDCP